MFKINKKVEYALIGLQHLNSLDDGSLVSVTKIAGEYKLSRTLMAKVMQQLAQAGIVESVQGPTGGYRMTKALKDVSFLDLSIIILGEEANDVCNCSGSGGCSLIETCTVANPLKRLGSKISDVFRDVSLEDLFTIQ